MAKVVNSDFPRVQTKKSERLVFLQVHVLHLGRLVAGGVLLTYCPQRMMNFRVEKILLLGINKEHEISTMFQIMIRINTIKPCRRRYLEAY